VGLAPIVARRRGCSRAPSRVLACAGSRAEGGYRGFRSVPDSAPGFAHLHNHTTYSLLDGAQRIEEMCRRAAEDGQPGIAITDHGNLFGVMEFAKKAAQCGVRPIVGIEAYVAPGSRLDRTPPRGGAKPYHHLILLARNYAGYKNLIRLASAGFLEGFYYRPRIDRELLERHHEGLICTTACLAGEVPSLLAQGRREDARGAAGWFRELFGAERFWLELQDHGLEDQQRVNRGVVELSRELGVGVVATNDCHYLLPEDSFAHDVLVCIQTGKTIHDQGRMRYTAQHYLKSRAEMGRLFAWAPEALENTLRVAAACSFAFEKQPSLLPEFPVPEGSTLDGYFEQVTREGFDRRLRVWRAAAEAGRLRHGLDLYRERLDREIRMIQDLGFAGYFLITWDFVRFARENGIPVGPGRGSAAGSLAAYCLGITDIDPMPYDLLFERFLNPERISLPDIDIDFCFRKRERVIEYVTEKYGRANVAQIITFGTMAARAVIRDVGRGLEIPYAEVDRIAKLVPAQPGAEVTIARALREVPPLRQAYDTDPRVRQLLDVAQRLEGLTRHASTHAAAVVIAPRPIIEFAPLYKGSKDTDEVTTQFPKDEIEEIGLLKMDFLGLRTLTLIDDALNSIQRATGRRPDIERMPLDDPAVYELFARGRTSGIFQFESQGMRDILRRFRPERFEDLIALNALYRPGPIGGGLIDDFIKRRHGKIRVEYPHPRTEPILRETYGVILYQEQVMQLASELAGYSLGEADILRSAMGKKNKAVMEAEEQRFIDRARDRGIKPGDARKVYEQMAHFAGYGFNKSHSAAYALVAYRTAWLKVHHPVAFMAALLTIEKDSTDSVVKYINECRDMGIRVLPPDVNTSGVDFTAEGGAIRFGLSAIKGVGEAAILALLEARERVGRFESLHAICTHVDPRHVHKRLLEALVQAGALDGLGARRSQLAAAVDSALEYGQKRRAEHEAGQGNLFPGSGAGAEVRAGSDVLPDLAEWDERTLLGYEKATLGFYVSGHPLESYRELLGEFASHSTAALAELPSGSEVAIGGLVGDLRRRKSRRGEWWASFVLEDLDGRVEVLVFPKAYQLCQQLLGQDQAILLAGRLEAGDARVRIVADSVTPLDELRERRAGALQLRVDAARLDEELIGRLRRAIEAHRGETSLLLEVARAGEFALVARADPALRVTPSPALTQALEALLGPGGVRYRAAGTAR
jgi:DNA polymerase-3 subunit alpha